MELSTRAFLHSYAVDEEARTLLSQAISVLGPERVRELDEEISLPLIRAALSETIRTGAARPVPVAIATEILFSLYCSAVLIIAAGQQPEHTASDVEAVLFTLLSGMRTQQSEAGSS
jgi:hypothetical protein